MDSKWLNRFLKWTPDQRIIFVSAYVQETLRDSVSQLKQIVELIQKPFDIDVVVELVEDLEIFSSVKKLSSLVKQIEDVNNPNSREIRELFKAAAQAHKGKTFNAN
jgi:two-component system, chemotaxis family, chemotaxis protein CheY